MIGKVCLVTGASQGIGKATAIALAKMGAPPTGQQQMYAISIITENNR